MLRRNFRSHPLILHLPNKFFYNDQLIVSTIQQYAQLNVVFYVLILVLKYQSIFKRVYAQNAIFYIAFYLLAGYNIYNNYCTEVYHNFYTTQYIFITMYLHSPVFANGYLDRSDLNGYCDLQAMSQHVANDPIATICIYSKVAGMKKNVYEGSALEFCGIIGKDMTEGQSPRLVCISWNKCVSTKHFANYARPLFKMAVLKSWCLFLPKTYAAWKRSSYCTFRHQFLRNTNILIFFPMY